MPMFENCPEEAERYRRNFVEYWGDAVSHVYDIIINTVGTTTDPKRIISLIEGMKAIKPPMQFNDKNDENMAKRHAFGDAVDAVKKYLTDEVNQRGHAPDLNDVLANLKAEPKYASVSISFG